MSILECDWASVTISEKLFAHRLEEIEESVQFVVNRVS